jgi:N-methylhydantoinase A
LAYYIGTDTGGTFTDCVVMDERGNTWLGKTPTTPPNFEKGIITSVEQVAQSLNMTLEDLLKQANLFVASSTTATNAMITGAGAKTGLITTEGFEDTIITMRAIGRVVGLGEEDIKHVVATNKPEPLVPKTLIKGVKERIDYKGEVLRPLSREDAEAAVEDLVKQGVEAIAVSFLWSFTNPVHEKLVGEIIRKRYPEVFVTLSHELVPRLGEYERTASTVINSYLGPLCSKYVHKLNSLIQKIGSKSPLLIMQSYGGCLQVDEAGRAPIGMLNSGPAAGVVGSKFLADILGYENVITTDVGGTSFDVGVIAKGRYTLAKEPSVNQYVILNLMLEVQSIGAGGGSIAWLEPETGIIKVGPDSAGAVPGPMCYDAGGTRPTLTDANLVLGFINPDYFLGGKFKLNADKAREGIEKQIAKPLGISVEEAAASIWDIASAHMLDLVRNVTVARGYDPSTFVMLVFGGAGPLHSTAYGRQAKLVIIPSLSSGYSAFGCITSDIMHTSQLGEPMLMPFDTNKLSDNFEKLERKVVDYLHADGFKDENIVLKRYADMRYVRQINELRVPIMGGRIEADNIEKVYDAFEKLYEEVYGKGAGYREAGICLETYYVEGRGEGTRPVLVEHEVKSDDPSIALKGERLCFLPRHRDFVKTRIYDYSKLTAGNIIPGAAIIETPVTTAFIDDDQVGFIDKYLNINIKQKE